MIDNSCVFVFINPHWIMGGVDTYFFRMMCWLREREVECRLLLPRNSAVDEEFYNTTVKLGVEIEKCVDTYRINHKIKPTKVKLNIDRSRRVFLMLCRADDIFLAQRIAQTNRNDFKIIHYMLHVKGFEPTKVLRSDTSLPNYLYFRGIYERYRRILQNNPTIVMDGICKGEFEKQYEYELSKEQVVPLGIKVPKEIAHSGKRNKEFLITTVCRFEFPYKAYVLGLIKQFGELVQKYNGIRLQIIGWGDGEERVKEAILSLGEDCSRNINVIGKVEYSDLEKYLLESDAYVGMGTTLIDAGKLGVPSIAVDFYTEESMSDGLLYDNGDLVAINASKRTAEVIETLINASDGEYEEICKKTYEIVREQYSIDSVMNKIIHVCDSPHSYVMSKWALSSRIICEEIIQRIVSNKVEQYKPWVEK